MDVGFFHHSLPVKGVSAARDTSMSQPNPHRTACYRRSQFSHSRVLACLSLFVFLLMCHSAAACPVLCCAVVRSDVSHTKQNPEKVPTFNASTSPVLEGRLGSTLLRRDPTKNTFFHGWIPTRAFNPQCLYVRLTPVLTGLWFYQLTLPHLPATFINRLGYTNTRCSFFASHLLLLFMSNLQLVSNRMWIVTLWLNEITWISTRFFHSPISLFYIFCPAWFSLYFFFVIFCLSI